MRNLIKNLITVFKTLKTILPFFAAIYLLTWCFEIYNENLFNKLNEIFGAFPNFFDQIIPASVDLNGSDVPMGYVYSACFCIVITLVSIKMLRVLEKKIVKYSQNENIENNSTKQKIQKEVIKPAKKIQNIKTFYALFEFQLKYLDESQIGYDNLEKLKTEYSKIIEKKLTQKYSCLKFVTSDKVFLICNDFEIVNLIINDIANLFEIISKIDKQKFIQTDLLFSCYATSKPATIKEILKILLKINALGNINKIVVNHDFYIRYCELQDRKYFFTPMGVSKLSNADIQNHDIEIDLYYLKKLTST